MKQPIPTNKILICLLFWEGDKIPAMKLARLLADLEPEHSEKADFLFVSRFDCSHDEDTIRYVSRKFNTHHYTSKRRGDGWPMGCNGVFFGAMEFVYHKMAAGLIPHYKAVLVIAPDGAPLTKNWLDYMIGAWAQVNAAKPTFLAGAQVVASGVEHINGDCAMFSGDLAFLKWLAVTVADVPNVGGWDWLLPEEFKRWGWANLPIVRSEWNCLLPVTQQKWDALSDAGLVWFHGAKGLSLINLARKNLL